MGRAVNSRSQLTASPARASLTGAASRDDRPGEVWVAGRVVAALGGRYSAGLGIDVDAGAAEVEQWFLAAA